MGWLVALLLVWAAKEFGLNVALVRLYVLMVVLHLTSVRRG
jgi:hypothetical protein